jgi:ABC-type multidrug transport system ATPase subunit
VNDTTAPVLEADCVSKRYGERLVLSSASLRARAGLVTGLLGRNGAGKSTLLRILVGSLQPDGGCVRFDGSALLEAQLAPMARRGLFFLPDRDLLHPAVSLGRQLRWLSEHFGTTSQLADVAQRLGVAHVLSSRPRALSGGETRRAEVAMALLRAPRVLVLDEPLRGIAPLDAEVVLDALRALARTGCAVVLTGHELPLLVSSLDAVTWCHAGRTREFGSVAEAMQDFGAQRDFWGPAR